MNLFHRIKTWIVQTIFRPVTVLVLKFTLKYYTFRANRHEATLMFYRRRRVNAATRMGMFLANKPMPPVLP